MKSGVVKSTIATALSIAATGTLAVFLGACGGPDRPSFESSPPSSTVTSTSPPQSEFVPETVVGPTSTVPTTEEVPPPAASSLQQRLERSCSVGDPEVTGFIENDAIVEASGMAKAVTHDGFWVLNDGAEARLFAVGPEGQDRGSTVIEGVQLWDLEDMAHWNFSGQNHLVMADIGDNGANRSTSHPLVVAVEPEAGAPTANAHVVFINYPDRAHNAEALIIDSEANEVVVITKEETSTSEQLLPALVFAGSLDGAEVDGHQIDLRLIGSIDIEGLRSSSSDTKFHPGELRGIAGLVTAADVSPDGRLVVMRTYGSVWMWARPVGASVAETILAAPCEAEPPFELQGEAIAFVDDTRWATLAEGSFPSLRLSPP